MTRNHSVPCDATLVTPLRLAVEVIPEGTRANPLPPTVSVNEVDFALPPVNVEFAVLSPKVVVPFAPATSVSYRPHENVLVPQVLDVLLPVVVSISPLAVPFSVITNVPGRTHGQALVSVGSLLAPATM